MRGEGEQIAGYYADQQVVYDPPVTADARTPRGTPQPGTAVRQNGYDRLRQDRVWVTRDGRRLRVGWMTPQHALNAVRMLERDAPFWSASYELGMVLSTPTGDPYDDDADDHFADLQRQVGQPTPGEWIKGTPMYRALARRAGVLHF